MSTSPNLSPMQIRYAVLGEEKTPKKMITKQPSHHHQRQPSSMRPRPPPPRRSSSAPARIVSRRRRRTLVEDHYRVDAGTGSLLPGLPTNDDDNDEREMHDFFNLIALVPVVVLNIINWDWDILIDSHRGNKAMGKAWTGQYFPLFYATTIAYFVADLIWVIQIPTCVKSPGVIIQHHIATLLYLVIPYMFPEEGWLMGACLIVEINTWLLIARRVFNKQGFGPWVIDLSLFSIRVKVISILFYVTWISIRCILYPCILRVLWTLCYDQYNKQGVIFNSRYAVALALHSIFCCLNFKWTFDLFMSKLRAWKCGASAKTEKGL